MSDQLEHRHLSPLSTARQQPDAKLPGSGFIAVVGLFDHATYVPYTGTKPDDNHVYLWLRLTGGPYAGRYEAAVNVHSDQGTGTRDLLYVTREQPLDPSTWPPIGVGTQAAVSYAALGLQDADFTSVQEGELRSLVMGYAQTCAQLAVYGIEYVEHTGLHDVHFNADEKDKDGALVFYFDTEHGGPIARWIFLKFQGDHV